MGRAAAEEPRSQFYSVPIVPSADPLAGHIGYNNMGCSFGRPFSFQNRKSIGSLWAGHSRTCIKGELPYCGGMDVQWMPEHNVGEDSDAPTYRARIWSGPIRLGYAWAVDEYEITNASEVREAIAWAEAEAAGRPLEFFVKWFESSLRAPDNEIIQVPWMMKLFGISPEED